MLPNGGQIIKNYALYIFFDNLPITLSFSKNNLTITFKTNTLPSIIIQINKLINYPPAIKYCLINKNTKVIR